MGAITQISSLPAFVSPEEHNDLTGSTPESFTLITPVLRHQEHPVSIKLIPPLDGWSDQDTTDGSLYIIESALVYMSKTGRGLQILYPSITLHAISRADGVSCIYCQLDEGTPDQDGDAEMREMSIFPQSITSLEPIFETLSLCSTLHPDTTLSEDEDDDMGEGHPTDFDTFTGDETEELSQVGRVALEHLESIIVMPGEAAEGEPKQNGINGIHA